MMDGILNTPPVHRSEDAVPRMLMTSAKTKQEANTGKLSPDTRREINSMENGVRQTEDRPVVELFNKERGNRQMAMVVAPAVAKNKKKDFKTHNDELARGPFEMHMDVNKELNSQPQRKCRVPRYQIPTIASQMKQAGMRCYYSNDNKTNIPFVTSKSTTPSYNIGVNLQQVLNGIKTKQPLTGIPMTVAHHMGMGYLPSNGTKSATTRPTLNNREINTIKVGQRLVRLPCYKSYDRLLELYREGDGVVSKFLRANSRPHYFYTSMYNLVGNHEDFDRAASKGRSGSQEAKRSLAEYASLYKEYEQLEAYMKNGNYDLELKRHKDELSRELAAREEHIRKVVQEYKTPCDMGHSTLRATHSTAENGYRHSTFKMNFGEPQQ